MKLSNHEHDWLNGNGAKMMETLGVYSGNTVVDFGCGVGRYTIPLSQTVGDNGVIIAFERNGDEIETLKQRISSYPTRAAITPIQSDETNLVEIQDQTLDAVFAFDVLQFIDDWSPFFYAVRRALRGSGRFHVYPAAIPHPDKVDLGRLHDTVFNYGFQLDTEQQFTMMHNKDIVTDKVYSYRLK